LREERLPGEGRGNTKGKEKVRWTGGRREKGRGAFLAYKGERDGREGQDPGGRELVPKSCF